MAAGRCCSWTKLLFLVFSVLISRWFFRQKESYQQLSKWSWKNSILECIAFRTLAEVESVIFEFGAIALLCVVVVFSLLVLPSFYSSSVLNVFLL